MWCDQGGAYRLALTVVSGLATASRGAPVHAALCTGHPIAQLYESRMLSG
jgi:hypothetical protein